MFVIIKKYSVWIFCSTQKCNVNWTTKINLNARRQLINNYFCCLHIKKYGLVKYIYIYVCVCVCDVKQTLFFDLFPSLAGERTSYSSTSLNIIITRRCGETLSGCIGKVVGCLACCGCTFDSRWGCIDLYYARGAQGVLPMRVGCATSQLDLPSLTPLSVAGCGWLQLGVPHWAASVDYCKKLIIDPTFCGSRFSTGRLLAIEDFAFTFEVLTTPWKICRRGRKSSLC